jgi:hypothetical protein
MVSTIVEDERKAPHLSGQMVQDLVHGQHEAQEISRKAENCGARGCRVLCAFINAQVRCPRVSLPPSRVKTVGLVSWEEGFRHGNTERWRGID